MIYWLPFKHDDKAFDLSHLHPQVWEFVQAGKGNKPARTYKIRIIYSLHCFTVKRTENGDDSLNYADNRETRTFCYDRYKRSSQLPAIIQTLGSGYVYHTGRQNFLTIDNGNGETFEVFFTVRKSKESNLDLQIYVQSAYVRTRGNSPRAGKIRFAIVAYNTLHNKPVKPHRR